MGARVPPSPCMQEYDALIAESRRRHPIRSPPDSVHASPAPARPPRSHATTTLVSPTAGASSAVCSACIMHMRTPCMQQRGCCSCSAQPAPIQSLQIHNAKPASKVVTRSGQHATAHRRSDIVVAPCSLGDQSPKDRHAPIGVGDDDGAGRDDDDLLSLVHTVPP